MLEADRDEIGCVFGVLLLMVLLMAMRIWVVSGRG